MCFQAHFRRRFSTVERMPRNQYRSYCQEQVDEAINRILVDGMSIRKAAKTYGIYKSTLFDQVAGKMPIKSTQGPCPYFNFQEETKKAKWAQQMARIGFGINRLELHVQQTVKKIVTEDNRETPLRAGMPGQKWPKGFLKRHPELSEREPELLGGERAVVTEAKMDENLDDYLVSKGCSSIHISPRRIFNCDKSGFPLSGKVSRVVATKGSRTVSSVGSSNKSQVTVLATISASDHVLPPTIVLAGQRFKENPLKDGPEACLGRCESEWMNSEVFFKYMANSFIPGSKIMKYQN
ncbi:uncharacterized protein LOC135154218 [Lytechinus pictus]|uniref:uncharacterized protein LOC135154218 n=1 Tax=Lytechinus pictus TaxID=7653 RepID=UPI0030B9ECE5